MERFGRTAVKSRNINELRNSHQFKLKGKKLSVQNYSLNGRQVKFLFRYNGGLFFQVSNFSHNHKCSLNKKTMLPPADFFVTYMKNVANFMENTMH